jgi:2-polyprenyl-3-methyl-5-hydroxy-6-metoxy-1,4-benzoquinol methylase
MSTNQKGSSARDSGVPDYGFKDADIRHHMAYILDPIEELAGGFSKGMRVLDVGCGNGFLASWLKSKGCEVVGIDPSASGVKVATEAHPDIRFVEIAVSTTILEDINEEPFDLVVSTEVVEHLYAPREWAIGCFHALSPGAPLICTTPYHGYLKNLMIAAMNKFDHHVNPMWDGGHIKFWSVKTLESLLSECGLRDIRWKGAGRHPYLWKSMVMRGNRPGA